MGGVTAMSVSVSGPHVNCRSLSVRVLGSLTRTEVSLVSTPATMMVCTTTVGVGWRRGGEGRGDKGGDAGEVCNGGGSLNSLIISVQKEPETGLPNPALVWGVTTTA